MKLKKIEFAAIICTVLLFGVTVGYLFGRIPVAGTFEITTPALIPRPTIAPAVTPEAEETGILPEEMPPSTDTEIFNEEILSVDGEDEPPAISTTAQYTPKPIPEGKVNVNTAGLEELQQLPGVGPAIAQRILDEREANGAYISLEDLLRVRGIGEKTLENMKEYVTVE